ncbi:MAG: ATP-grasp fold amidoligase family protein [Spirochaetia bacterium]|nr:ATP-grasp fold amidoligase family protein [Spirochaetia bacterium]
MKITNKTDGRYKYASIDGKKITAHPLLYILLYSAKDLLRSIPFFTHIYDSLSFFSVTGYLPKIKKPRSLNEHVLWMKQNLKTDLMVQCADKIAVRDYVSQTVGKEYLVKQYYSGTRPEEIDFDELPDRAVIKPNHVSGKVLFYQRGTSNISEIKTLCDSWLGISAYGQNKGEWAYSGIEPAIIIEEDLSSEDGKPPIDYKFFVSNGRVLFTQLDIGRFYAHRRMLLDSEWKSIDVVYEYPRPDSYTVEKPACAEEMLEVAKKLAEPFPLCRVDLYEYKGRPRFGEITFYPASGKAAFVPKEYDFIFGEMVKLPWQ